MFSGPERAKLCSRGREPTECGPENSFEPRRGDVVVTAVISYGSDSPSPLQGNAVKDFVVEAAAVSRWTGREATEACRRGRQSPESGFQHGGDRAAVTAAHAAGLICVLFPIKNGFSILLRPFRAAPVEDTVSRGLTPTATRLGPFRARKHGNKNGKNHVSRNGLSTPSFQQTSSAVLASEPSVAATEE